MKRLAHVLAFAAVALPAPSSAQSTSFGPTFVQTFFGCAAGVSCHAVTLSWSHNASGYAVGTVRAQSWFGINPWHAGYPWRLIVSSLPYPYWTGQREEYWTRFTTMEEYVDETWQFSSGDPVSSNWAPTWLQMQVAYGVPAGEPGYGPYGETIRLTATPEPATLLLLGTGLLSVGALNRRRKRSADT